MIWSVKKYLLKPRMAPDVINLKVLELETAKEILSEQFDADPNEVDDMIRQRMDAKLLAL